MTADCAAIARRRVSRRAGCDFDELYQVAQIAAWRAPERYKGVAAKSAVIDHVRRNTGRRRVCTELPTWAIRPDFQEPENIEARVVSQRAMRILPVRLYRIVYAKFWLGMKQVEIARAIGVNEARVHQLLSDAMDRMRMEVAA